MRLASIPDKYGNVVGVQAQLLDHAKPVKAWLADHADAIEVYYLPSYSPDLNSSMNPFVTLLDSNSIIPDQ